MSQVETGTIVIPRNCKRLAEVDFPIAEVSGHAAKEKFVRSGHPSTLHKWWAQRPLASCRCMLLALLWPDPADSLCPPAFRKAARTMLSGIPNSNPGSTDLDLRNALIRFIGDFAHWELAKHPEYLRVARGLVAAAHGKQAPVVVDPFAGGGSIPLEALRLGCDAYASDLNPVACFVMGVMLEQVPAYHDGIADKLRGVGSQIVDTVRTELEDVYPTDPDGAMPIAYVWARTVRCEAPGCGAEIPLIRSFWLCKKPVGWALRPKIRGTSGVNPPEVALEVFEPKNQAEVHGPTVARATATCLCCGSTLPPSRVRAQLAVHNGGTDTIFDDQGRRTAGARLIGVVTRKPGRKQRDYRSARTSDYTPVRVAHGRLARLVGALERDNNWALSPVPTEDTPSGGGTGAGRAFSVQRYGMLRWHHLFPARQQLTLVTLLQAIRRTGNDKNDLDRTLMPLLGCAFNVFLRTANGNARLHPNASIAPAFGMQTLPITWTFPETVLAGGRAENFDGAVGIVARVVDQLQSIGHRGHVQLADACDHPLPDEVADVWFTDPPYYDAIPYSDLSDFFLVWLKRLFPDRSSLNDPFDPDNPLSPKEREAVQDETKTCEGQVKDREFFEHAISRAFEQGRRVLRSDGIGSVVFAHKTTEGWEALLSGLIQGGWTVTGSWPIATESAARLRARDSAALATSVHLILRPRSVDAPVGDWADVLVELPKRVAHWMDRLAGEGVRGADLVFACIGPALEIFSRYTNVETAEGKSVGLATYLERVWEIVGKSALNQVLGTGDELVGEVTGTLEEDARLTALFLWTRQSSDLPQDSGESRPEKLGRTDGNEPASGLSLPFDVVRRFAQPMGIDIGRWTGHVVDQDKGVVRLLPVVERERELFGDVGMSAVAGAVENDPGGTWQQSLFPELDAQPLVVSRRGKGLVRERSEHDGGGGANGTVLDRVHTAMLFQLRGHTTALRALIEAEQGRGPDFMRLANALSALYPRGSQEKRLLDAMLLAAPK